MSAEGKKKRGVSGATNAKNIPFRYHGYPKGYTVSTTLGRSDHPRMGGSRFLNAMKLGVMLPNFQASHRMYLAADEAIDHIEGRRGEGRKTYVPHQLAAE